MTPTSKNVAIRQTAGYFAFYVAIGLILSSLGSSLPALSTQTGSTLAQLGALFTALSLGRISGALTLGHIFDRKPAHPFMALLLATIGILMAAAPLIHSLAALLAVFFVTGIAWGALDVAVNTLLVWIWGKRGGQFLSGLHLFFALGAIVAPFIVSAALHWNNTLQPAYGLFAALLLANALWLLLSPSPRIETPAPGAAAQTTRWLFVGGIVLLVMICIGEEVAFAGWIFSYMANSGLATQSQAILLNALFWVSLAVGRLVSIPLTGRLSPKQMLTFDLAGCVLSLALIMLWPGSRVMVWAGTMLLGFSVATVFPMIIAYTQQNVPLTGRITSLLMIGDGIGGMIFPWLAGYLFEKVSPAAMIAQIFACFALGLVVFAALTATRGKPVPAKR